MKVPLSDIMNFMEEIAPASSALDWDNVGLQLGDPHSSVSSVLLCLDVSPRVVEEAYENTSDLIISHHPLIFRPVKKIDFSTPSGKIIRDLIIHGIDLFTAHTNLDRSSEGTGMVLAGRLGLKNVCRYSDDPGSELNMVITGTFETALSIDELSEIFRKELNCKQFRYVGNPYGILKAAIIPGSAGSLLEKIRTNFDIVITGELSYHEALNAAYRGQAVALAGHYVSEKPVMFNLKKLLEGRFPSLTVKIARYEGEPYQGTTSRENP